MTSIFHLIIIGLYLLTPYFLVAACIITGLYAAYRHTFFKKVTVNTWDKTTYIWIKK